MHFNQTRFDSMGFFFPKSRICRFWLKHQRLQTHFPIMLKIMGEINRKTKVFTTTQQPKKTKRKEKSVSTSHAKSTTQQINRRTHAQANYIPEHKRTRMYTYVYFVYMHTCSDTNNLVRSTGGFASHSIFQLLRQNLSSRHTHSLSQKTKTLQHPCSYH